MENRTFSEWVEHIEMNVTHTYSERNGKLFVRTVGANGNHTYEIPKGQAVEEILIVNAPSEITLKLSDDFNYLHVSNKEEMAYLEQIAGIKIKYATTEKIKSVDDFKILHREKTEELKKIFNEQGFLILSDIEGSKNLDNIYALEVVVSGRTFRIYIDIDGKKVSYQAIDSRNPFSGKMRSCKKIGTLLKQLKTYTPPAVDDADVINTLEPPHSKGSKDDPWRL
jgi:hypothetical protein